jgi:predicted GTPase
MQKQKQEEEKKGPYINIKEEPQESGEIATTQNVLIIGPSGSGKSSLINYIAGKELAEVGDDGKSCTKINKSYEVTFENRKLMIFDTQGFNDTETGFINGNGNVASKIKFQLMNNSSTKQIDAIWIVQSCLDNRSYLD